MGLTIHVHLRVARALPDPAALALVHAAHRAATKLVRRRGLATITPVVPDGELSGVARWVFIKIDAHTSTAVEVPPLAGWCFAVMPGEGCEPLILGLSRHPATVKDAQGKTRRTKLARGWSFQCSCKTQYAGVHGWPHFLKCHRAVIDLARLWETAAGVAVEINDEGQYWPGRRVRTLREHLATYDRAVAGLAGALHDAADESGDVPVQSSIFAHPNFEHLEAEGAHAHGEMLRAAQKAVEDETKRGKPN